MNKNLDSSSGNGSSKDTIDSLSSTAQTFESRMKRKLKERDAYIDECEKATASRQALMLHAMTTIRKALGQSARLNLGGQFELQLKVSDWEGWPRIDLALHNNSQGEKTDYALIILTHDRDSSGTIQINTKSGEILGRVLLSKEGEFEKLPFVLKKSIRQFLDSVEAFILEPKASNATQELKPIPLDNQSSDTATQGALSEENFFIEDSQANDNTASTGDAPPLEGV